MDANTESFHDELLDFVLQQTMAMAPARTRTPRHNRANPGLHFEPPLLYQVLNDLVRRVGVDFQVGRQRANRRKGLTWLKLAADERLRRRKDHLVEDGSSGLERESEQCHINNVTGVTVGVKDRRLRVSSSVAPPPVLAHRRAARHESYGSTTAGLSGEGSPQRDSREELEHFSC
jgi:hypothetical protein